MKTVQEMGDYFYDQKAMLGLGKSNEMKKVYMSRDLIDLCKSESGQDFKDDNILRFAGVPVIEVVGENYFEVGI